MAMVMIPVAIIMLIFDNDQNSKANMEDKVYKIIKEHHNYEIPEISTIQTSNVDKDYEQWLKDFVEE